MQTFVIIEFFLLFLEHCAPFGVVGAGNGSEMMPPCPPSTTSEQQAGSSRSRKPLGPTSSSLVTGQSRGSMNDIFHKQHSSSDEEDEADLSNANAQANKKGNMKQGHNNRYVQYTDFEKLNVLIYTIKKN